MAPLLAPLVAAGKTALAGGASAIASQGLGGAARIAGRMASKKVGELASKEGMKQLAQEGAKRVASKEGMNAAMDKLRQEQQKKEAENRQMQQELMEAGRGGASTGSTTMG